MRIRGIGNLKRTARRLRSRFAPSGLILLYHRVIEVESDPQLLSVTPQHFAEHLEVLQKHYHPMSLQDLVYACKAGNLPQRAVGITFDDGYSDNLFYAKPLLERYGCPATVFVTLGYLEQEREFWWDELDGLLLTPGILPKTLNLSINGNTCQSDLGDASRYSEDNYKRHRTWNVLDSNTPSSRQFLYRSLHQLLRPLSESERRKVLDDLIAWGGSERKVRPTHHALSPDGVVRMAEGGLIEIGAHTVTHPSLSALPLAMQRTEIQQSKDGLEEILGSPVASFAYPYGSPSDYSAETVDLVQEAGFACACSNFEGLIYRGTNLFQIPRFLVRDWDGEEFARYLDGWFRG